MDTLIAKDLNRVASEARRKANYLRLRPSNSDTWNAEQMQDASAVLEEIASKLETLIAKYYIHYGLVVAMPDGEMLFDKAYAEYADRRCKTAIKRELKRETPRR